MNKKISLFLSLWLLILSCAKNTQDPDPQYNNDGNQASNPAREEIVNLDPWQNAGIPIIPTSMTIRERIRSLMFEDGLRIDYNGDSNGDGNGIGYTDDEEICRQQDSEGELFGICMALSADRRIFCKIDDSPQPNCDEIYAQWGDDFECESKTLNGDPILNCSDGWGILANGEKDKSKTICRVLLSNNSGRCLNAYKEQDDGTGTLIPVEADELILNMQNTSWQGYNSGHAANPLQAFDTDPPLSPLPLTDLSENTTLNYKTSDPTVCTIDNDQNEANGIQGTLSLLVGSTPAICTVILTIEREDYADRILSIDIELVEDNDSTWTGYANALSVAPYNDIFYAGESLSPDPIAGTLSTPELSYQIEDENICTVDENSGEVSGITTGSCIINLLVSQDGYLDKKLLAIIPVAPLREYQGVNWIGFPNHGDIAVGETSSQLAVPTSIPPAIGIDDYTVEWKSGDCIWIGGSTRTITLNNTNPCTLTVSIKKRGYKDFIKDFTVIPAPGVQSGLSWSPTQSSGTVGIDLVLDAFSVPLTNNETLRYVVSDTSDTGCHVKGLSGDDTRTLIFQKDGICIVQVVVSRSGYQDWNSPEISITVGQGSITVADWGNYEGVLNGSTVLAPELTNLVPSQAGKSYTTNTVTECSVDPTSGTVRGLSIGSDNCHITLTLSHIGYNDETHIYTLSVWSGVVDISWNGYSSDTISISNRATPPTLLPPVSATPGATFEYATTDTSCNIDSGTGALSILTSGTCTITLTASANNYRSIKKKCSHYHNTSSPNNNFKPHRCRQCIWYKSHSLGRSKLKCR